MKFQIERDILAEAVAWTARALPSKPASPILACMHLTAGRQLALSTFDYETSAQADVPVVTDGEGSVLVSGRLLAEIVKALPPRPVEIGTDGTLVTLKCGRAVFTLNSLPDGEYPTLPDMPEMAGKVGADLLAVAISQVAVAAGKDDTLPALTGVRVEIDGDTLTLVATDRFRLAVRELHWEPAGRHDPVTVLVPARSLTEVARSLTAAAEVTIALEAQGGNGATGIIGFEAGGRQTTSRLLGGEYPRYQTLLPTEFSAVAELDVAPFTDAVKRVALVAERNTPIRLAFTAGEVTLEAGAGEEARAVETAEASFDGDPMGLAFNPQYLLDGLAAIDSGTARLSLTTPTKPAVLTGKRGDEAPDYRYVLMPIRSDPAPLAKPPHRHVLCR